MRAISLLNDKVIPAYIPIEMKNELLSTYKYIFKGVKDYDPFMSISILKNNFGNEIDNFDEVARINNYKTNNLSEFLRKINLLKAA